MIAVDVSFVFSSNAEDTVTLVTNRATLKALLNELSGGVTYYNGEPTEDESELVEQGIADITEALS
jgi:hypothetical protein